MEAQLEAQANDATMRVADLEAELAQARADADRLRTHAAALGDELAAVRAMRAEGRTAVPASAAGAAERETFAEPSPVARPPLARRRPRAEREAAKEAVGDRRTAVAELAAIASASEADDFTFRRP
jgi:hypothetical protein